MYVTENTNPSSTRVATRPAPGAIAPAPAVLTHREIIEVLIGLLSALFVAILSSTIVSTALPTIVGQLHGTQTQYTWVVTASLLAMTVSGPIWSKLADLYDKKKLVQISILVFVVGSVTAGSVQGLNELLAARAIQGLGMGGLVALAQAILGTIIPPRERGRYSGYMAATMAVATVSGPLLGGVIVDSLGWRWCFFATLPFAIFAMVMLQRYLSIASVRRQVRIDWWGALFIALAASLPLVWVSFAGSSFAWASMPTVWFWLATLVAVAVAIRIERRHSEPLVPPRILADRMTQLAIIASIAVGIAQFGASVFLSQYFQVARGHSPTDAGLLMLPLIIGSMLGSTLSGRYITNTGVWKQPMLLGSVLLVTGLGLMVIVDHSTSMVELGAFMALIGLGTGALMQNLVLVVQNTVDVSQIGAASGVVSFFRSLGGTIGVAVLGAFLASGVQDRIADGLAKLGVPAGSSSGGGDLDLTSLPAPVLHVVRTAYADQTGWIFFLAGCVAVVTIVAVALMPPSELRTTIAKTDAKSDAQQA